MQQEVEEDLVEELGILLLRQVPRVRDHLHRRLLPELPACAWKSSDVWFIIPSLQ